MALAEKTKREIVPRSSQGKPTTPEDKIKILDAVIERLVDGESLREICLDDDMPNKVTILRWTNSDSGLATSMARAREMQADALDDDITGVIKEIRDGTLDANQGRVIINAHQWRAAALKPKLYGTKQTVDVNHGIKHMDVDQLEVHGRELAARLGIILPAGLLVRPEKADG